MKMPATRAQLRRWLSASLIVAIPALPGMAMAGWWDNNDEPEAEETGIVKWWDDGLVGQLHLVESVVNLNQNNLIDSYAEFPANVDCPDSATDARQPDGTCNDLNQTRMGSKGVRFGRNVDLSAGYPDPELMSPNPRMISRELMTRDEIKEVDFLSYWATAWIQFMVHDWMSHENSETEFHEVPLAEDDPLRAKLGDTLDIPVTEVDPTWTPYENTPPAYVNRLTHWWDGSQLYGSDAETAAQVRTFQDGKLKIEESGRLPTDPQTGLPVTGFNDNLWLGLQMMHELFVKENNAIADMLKSEYPNWSDEQLFNKARLINAAVMAKIHTIDWTPAILNSSTTKAVMNLDWELVAGGDKNLREAPFSLTQEFVAVYRMHPLLRDSVEMLDVESGQTIEEVSTKDQAFAAAPGVLDALGSENVYYSFGMSHPGQLTLNNFPKFLQNLELPDGQTLDMAAVDIIRDRERGVPRYNDLRRQLDMPPIADFADLTPDEEMVAKLREVYDNDVEKLDAVVGQLAEGYRPEGFGFSDTTFRIFTVMAPRRFQADRFYTNDFNERVYTPEGMDWIKKSNFRKVILRHTPGLEDELELVGNPFFPWDTDSCDWRARDKLNCSWKRLKNRFRR